VSKSNWKTSEINFVINLHKKGHSRREIAKLFRIKFNSTRTCDSIKHCLETYAADVERALAKVLLVDIETKPKKSWHWGVWDQSISHNMMIEDTSILSWSAKWIGEPESKVIYKDQRGKEKNLMNDKALLKPLSELMSQADIIIWQNGDGFDYGEINNRLAEHKLPIPDSYKTIDTKKIAKRHLRLPWYSLAYMTERFNTKYKKQSHSEFPGFSLWDQVIKGNKKAWDCMKKYNNFDVLSMEELFTDTLAVFAKGNERVAEAMRAFHAARNKKS
jgi:DNA polymerase elongation subunit (family B)